MNPVVWFWWNFLWSFSGVLLVPWHHIQLCQKPWCASRLQKGTKGWGESWCQDVWSQWNFQESFLRLLLASWLHLKLCQEPPCSQRLKIKHLDQCQESPCPFKSLSGVLEDMKVPEKAGNDVEGLRESLGSFTKILSKSDKRLHVKWSFFKIQFFGSKTPSIDFWSI